MHCTRTWRQADLEQHHLAKLVRHNNNLKNAIDLIVSAFPTLNLCGMNAKRKQIRGLEDAAD